MDHDAALDEIFNLEQLVASSTASIPLSSTLPTATVVPSTSSSASSSSSSSSTATLPPSSSSVPSSSTHTLPVTNTTVALDDDIHDVFADLERELADIGIDTKVVTNATTGRKPITPYSSSTSTSIRENNNYNNAGKDTNIVPVSSTGAVKDHHTNTDSSKNDEEYVLSSNLDDHVPISRFSSAVASSSSSSSSVSYSSSSVAPLSPLTVISDELHNQNPYATSTMDNFPLDIPLPDTPIPWSVNDMQQLSTLIDAFHHNTSSKTTPTTTNTTTTVTDGTDNNNSNSNIPSLSSQIIDLCMQHHCLPPSHRTELYGILLKIGKHHSPQDNPPPNNGSTTDGTSKESLIDGIGASLSSPDSIEDTPTAEPLNEEYIHLIQQYVNKTVDYVNTSSSTSSSIKVSSTEIARIIQAYITSRLLPFRNLTYFFIVQITVVLSTFIDNRDTLFVVLFDLMETFFPRYFHRHYTVDSKDDTYYSRFGYLLHSLCMYHEPELCSTLDQTYPLWYTVQSTLPSWITETSSASTASSTVTTGTIDNGCVPIGWMEGLFLGNEDTKPQTILPLLDRLVLAYAVLGKDKIGTLHTYPSSVNFSILSLCASLILREAVSLRVICRTAVGGAGARTLITSTLANAMKRMLWSSSSSSSSSSATSTETTDTSLPTNDEYLSSTVAWIAQSAKLANSTPQSILVQYKSITSSSSSSLSTGANTSSSPLSIDNTMKISVREILSQIVYGWPRVAIAAEKERSHSNGTTVADTDTETFRIQEIKNSLLLKPLRSLLPCPTSLSFPLRFLLVDVRPMSHRKAGRIAIAYNIDARTCVKPVDAAASSTMNNQHEVDEEEAAVSGETVTNDFSKGEDNHAFLPSPPTSPNASFSASATPSSSSSLSIFSPSNESSAHHEGPSALTYVGIPLPQAIEELKAISGKLHVVITGIGARLIPAAYQPHLRKACFEADDERVLVTAAAFMNAGFRYVSILDGGYSAIHACVRGKGLLPPSLLPLLDKQGNTPLSTLGVPIGMDTEEVAMAMRGCMIDHSPRKCPFCRHTAVLRLMAKQQQQQNANITKSGNLFGSNLRSLPPVQDVAKVAADLFDGLVHSATETVANLRTELGIQPTDVPLPHPNTFPTPVVPNDLQLPRLTQAQIDSMVQARDRTMSSILDALRSGSEKASATASILARDMAVAAERVKEASVTTNLSKQLATKLNEVTTKIQAPRNTTKGESNGDSKGTGKPSTEGNENSTKDSTLLSSENLVSPTKMVPEADGFAIGAEDDDDNTATGSMDTDTTENRNERNTLSSSLSDEAIPSQSLSMFTANSKVSSPTTTTTNAIPEEVRQKTKAAVLIAKGVLQSALAPPPPTTTVSSSSSSSGTHSPVSMTKPVGSIASSPSSVIVPPPLPSWSSIEKAADIAGTKLREGTKTLVTAANQAVNSPPQPGTLGAALANMDKRKSTTSGSTTGKNSPPVKQLASTSSSSPGTTNQSSGSANTQSSSSTAMNNTFASFRTRLAGFSEKAQEGMKIVAANIASTVPPATTTNVRSTMTNNNSTKPSSGTADPTGLLRSIDEELENSLKSSLSLYPIQALDKGDMVDIEDVRFRASSTLYTVHKQSEQVTKNGSSNDDDKPTSTDDTHGGSTTDATGSTTMNSIVLKPRVLALSRVGDRLIVLAPIEENHGDTSTQHSHDESAPNCAYKVKANHSLTELAKVSYSKKKPGRIVLWYRKHTKEDTAHENTASATETNSTELKERIYHFTTAEQAYEFLQNLQRYQQQHSSGK